MILDEDELKQRLENVSKNIQPEVIKAMRSACLGVERTAKQYCTPGSTIYHKAPFQTGRLRASITSRVETGGGAVHGLVGTNVLYAVYVHDGTSKMEARPFLLDAITARHGDTVELLRNAIIRAALREAGAPEDFTIHGTRVEDLDLEALGWEATS